MQPHQITQYLRDQRYQVLSDAEAWMSLVHAFEFVGKCLSKDGERTKPGLKSYENALLEPVKELCDKTNDPKAYIEAAVEFDRIIELRNDAVHNGSAARNLAQTCVSFSVKLEGAFMSKASKIRGVMVPTPVHLSHEDRVVMARRLMLSNSFSALPIECPNGYWRILTDSQVAKYRSFHRTNLGDAMFKTIGIAYSKDEELGGQLSPATILNADDDLSRLWEVIDSGLVLVTDANRLVGVVSAFDLL